LAFKHIGTPLGNERMLRVASTASISRVNCGYTYTFLAGTLTK